MTDQPPRVARPTTADELTALVRDTLRDLGDQEPEEYALGKFLIVSHGLEFNILSTEENFPGIRVDHRVLEVADEMRSEVIDFANALHGRSSTAGAHWWLGTSHLWQIGHVSAAKFDDEIFADFLLTFITIANDRTPEIRARLGALG